MLDKLTELASSRQAWRGNHVKDLENKYTTTKQEEERMRKTLTSLSVIKQISEGKYKLEIKKHKSNNYMPTIPQSKTPNHRRLKNLKDTQVTAKIDARRYRYKFEGINEIEEHSSYAQRLLEETVNLTAQPISLWKKNVSPRPTHTRGRCDISRTSRRSGDFSGLLAKEQSLELNDTIKETSVKTPRVISVLEEPKSVRATLTRNFKERARKMAQENLQKTSRPDYVKKEIEFPPFQNKLIQYFSSVNADHYKDHVLRSKSPRAHQLTTTDITPKEYSSFRDAISTPKESESRFAKYYSALGQSNIQSPKVSLLIKSKSVKNVVN